MGAAGGARSARVATAPGGCKTRAAIPRPARGYAPTPRRHPRVRPGGAILRHPFPGVRFPFDGPSRSEEHTSELQSRVDLVCRLLLEKKKTIQITSRQKKRIVA